MNNTKKLTQSQKDFLRYVKSTIEWEGKVREEVKAYRYEEVKTYRYERMNFVPSYLRHERTKVEYKNYIIEIIKEDLEDGEYHTHMSHLYNEIKKVYEKDYKIALKMNFEYKEWVNKRSAPEYASGLYNIPGLAYKLYDKEFIYKDCYNVKGEHNEQ